MTVSIVVIMFELTGALTYVLPIMVSVLISKWVGDAFGAQGIYEAWIAFNGYPFLDSRSEKVGGGTTSASAPTGVADDTLVRGLMTSLADLVTLTARGHSIASLEKLLESCPYRGFPVVATESDPVLLGYVSRTDLAHALSNGKAGGDISGDTPVVFAEDDNPADPSRSLDLRPWMDQTPITLNERSSLQLTTSLFLRLGLRYVLFVDRGQLRGLLTKKDVWVLLGGGGESAGAERVHVETLDDARDGHGGTGTQTLWDPSERRDEGDVVGEGEGEESGLLGEREEGAVIVDRSTAI